MASSDEVHRIWADRLVSRPVNHPVKCREFRLSSSEGELTCETQPWWPGSESARGASIPFTIRCHDVVDLVLHEHPRIIEHLALSLNHPLALEYGSWQEIFGRAPLPDPYRFFLEFAQVVSDRVRIPRNPVSYLNYRGTMNEWQNIVYSRSYLLLAAPTAIVEATLPLLDAQLAEYSVLPHTRKGPVAADGAPVKAKAIAVLELNSGWIVAGSINFED